MFLHPHLEHGLENREYNGYFYTINSKNNNTLFLRCKERQRHSCYATAKIVNNQFTLSKGHNHAVDQDLSVIYRFNNALYNAVISSLQCFRVIYDEICIMDPEGASHVPFCTVRENMRRWRSAICPQLPSSWENYVELLNMDVWQKFTTYNEGHLNVTAVRGTDGSMSVVYGDLNFIQNIHSDKFSIDATFKITPRKPKVLQLLTVMARIDDCMVPIIWALMTRKSTEAYVAVLQHVATILAPHLRPSSFMLDYERALAAALRTTYPAARQDHCYFHYCQALTKKAKKLKLLPLIRACRNRGIVFRKIMALALLPANEIATAFEWIVDHATADIARDFGRFFVYYETYWIRNVGSAVFSVFGLAHKTNNDIESYHRVLLVRMGIHPSVWQFTQHLCDLQAVIRSSHESLNLALPIIQICERKQIAHRTIQRAWQLYADNLLDVPRFLACASHCLKAFNDEDLITEDQVENFVNLDLNPVEVNDMHQCIAFEENLDEVRIFRRELPGQRHEIVLHPEMIFQACILCRVNLMDTLSLPCCHPFACAPCTRGIIELSRTENADIRCGTCGTTATEFHTIIIVQE